MRKYLKDHDLEDIGIRTKKFKSCIVKELVQNYSFSEDEAVQAAESAIKVSEVASIKEGKKDVVEFFSEQEIMEFAKVIANNKDDVISKSPSKEVKSLLINAVRNNPSTDILLFGRMFANDPSLDYDAACQVAHAISVNEARMEYDYFTAVDDVPDETNSGSAFLDTKQFTDPIFYRYANVNLSESSELIRFDKSNAAKAARDFVEAFILSMPTGSINGYANSTLPDYIMITLREDMPVSFAPAFINAVSGNDFESAAEDKLVLYADKIAKNYGVPAIILTLKDAPFNEILSSVYEEILRRLQHGDTAS